MRARRRTTLLAMLLVGGAALAFLGRGAAATGGAWPVPLDDTFIHFQFARAAALGHPMEWIAGQGYSSGETAPLYAAALAVLHALGFEGERLAPASFALACGSLLFALRRVASLVASTPRSSAPLALLVFVAPAVVAWSWFSGMEAALFTAILVAVLAKLAECRGDARWRRRGTRARAQLELGALLSALVLIRPESVVLVAVFAVSAARGAGPSSPLAALLRVAAPAAAVEGALLTLNRAATGTFASAGATLKLLGSNPFLSDAARARAYVENVVVFAYRCLLPAFGGSPFAAIPWLVAIAASLTERRARSVALPALVGAFAWVGLASWNGAAPFQNFRYYAPALVLATVAATLGVAVTARRTTRPWVPIALVVAMLAAAARDWPRQVDHFARASANIHDQQVRLGKRMRTDLPRSSRILVGDAGALAYFSELAAVDALGLGGTDSIPFARAATHGEGAMLELVESMATARRPTHLALYPNWFPRTTSLFGTELFRATLTDNVICGGTDKVVYAASWAGMAATDDEENETDCGARVRDSLDVANVVSERAHDYEGPFPTGGFTSAVVRPTARRALRFDGGRLVPAGLVERFRARISAPMAGARVVLRCHDTAGTVTVETSRGSVTLAPSPQPSPDHFVEASASIGPLEPGDTLTLRAGASAYTSYHVWIVED